MEKVKNLLRQKAGFTLVELLVVIAIISILAGLVLVNVSGQQKKGREAKRRADMTAYEEAIDRYINENADLPRDNDILSVNGSDALSTALINGNFLRHGSADPNRQGGAYDYKYYWCGVALRNWAECGGAVNANRALFVIRFENQVTDGTLTQTTNANMLYPDAATNCSTAGVYCYYTKFDQ